MQKRSLHRKSDTPGVGYVLYHTWKLENLAWKVTSKLSESAQKEMSKWARRCFSVGEEASKLLPQHELAWAFSINHCAYVGIVTDIEPQKTEQYFKALLAIESYPNFWNFRFADTIGTYYLLKSERLWQSAYSADKKLLDLSEFFGKAEEYFKKAKSCDIGDIDINEHINRLKILKKEYEIFQSGIKKKP